MAFFGGLDKLLNRAGDTAKREVISPLSRLLNRPQQKPAFAVAPGNKIDLRQGKPLQGQVQPAVPEYQGTQAVLNAQKELRLTPEFALNLKNAHPYVGRPPESGSLKGGAQAAAVYWPQQYYKRPNSITLGPELSSQDPQTVLHEGLHRVWDTVPQARKQFAKAYNQDATPGLKKYLSNRLSVYSEGADLPNEAHSFVPERSQMGIELPGELGKYYGKYYDPAHTAAASRRKLQMFQMGRSLNQVLRGYKGYRSPGGYEDEGFD